MRTRKLKKPMGPGPKLVETSATLIVTSASLLVTSALLVVTMFASSKPITMTDLSPSREAFDNNSCRWQKQFHDVQPPPHACETIEYIL